MWPMYHVGAREGRGKARSADRGVDMLVRGVMCGPVMSRGKGRGGRIGREGEG